MPSASTPRPGAITGSPAPNSKKQSAADSPVKTPLPHRMGRGTERRVRNQQPTTNTNIRPPMKNGSKFSRRQFVAGAATLAGSAAVLHKLQAQTQTFNGDQAPLTNAPLQTHADSPPGEPGRDYTPVITPNGSTLPWKLVGGVKVYHLIAQEVRNHEFAPGLVAHCWGFNGQVHGPTIEAVEGDRVRIYVTNKLPAPTASHWHGIFLPNGMDGVSGLTQKPIDPGDTFKYEFTLRQHGTHMYHSHHDEMTQMALGLMGLFVIHPRNPKGPRPDRDFAFMLSEWKIIPGTSRPDPQ